MRIQTQTQIVETNTTLNTMSAAQNPLFWQAIFSTLYSNEYRWIIEYAQNARDVDPNWRLTLPSALHPFMVFRDEGPGMSREFMQTTFCTAFESTKSNSDTYAGGFGIGRLSGPDGTIFEVHHDGILTTYALTRNKDSIPALVELSTEPTSRTGVTVKVPVSDISRATHEAETLLRFFHPQFPEPDYVIKTKRWAVQKSKSSQRQDPILVVDGYPYPLSSFDYPLRNFVLFVENSEVDVALSRENLKYTDKTKDTLKTLLDDIAEELPSLLPTPNDWESVTFINELRTYLSYKLQKQIKPHEIDLKHATVVNLYQRRRLYFDHCCFRPTSKYCFVHDDKNTTYRLKERLEAIPGDFSEFVVYRDTNFTPPKGAPYYKASEIALPPPSKSANPRSKTKYRLLHRFVRSWDETDARPTANSGVYVPFHNGDPQISLANGDFLPSHIEVWGIPATLTVPKGMPRLDEYLTKNVFTPARLKELAQQYANYKGSPPSIMFYHKLPEDHPLHVYELERQRQCASPGIPYDVDLPEAKPSAAVKKLHRTYERLLKKYKILPVIQRHYRVFSKEEIITCLTSI